MSSIYVNDIVFFFDIKNTGDLTLKKDILEKLKYISCFQLVKTQHKDKWDWSLSTWICGYQVCIWKWYL